MQQFFNGVNTSQTSPAGQHKREFLVRCDAATNTDKHVNTLGINYREYPNMLSLRYSINNYIFEIEFSPKEKRITVLVTRLFGGFRKVMTGFHYAGRLYGL
jgi:hypothetical protein